MKLITGGAYSGKKRFVTENMNIFPQDIADGSECDFNEVFTAKCVINYHSLVKRIIAENNDPVAFTEKLCEENSGITVIMDEIGCGIVPVERTERLWREDCGRCGCILSGKSDTVIRVVCGIGTVIKGEL